MRVGEFVFLLNTTKDTVRHYEDLNLINPSWKGKSKDYGDKDIQAFHVIVKLKDFGLSLIEIQLIFELKNAFGCGDKKLVKQVLNQLTNQLEVLRLKEEEIHKRRVLLHNEVEKIKELL